jgi:hypothetical protein
MLLISIVLFAVAAVLGLTVAVALFKRKPTSKAVALTHGLVGAAGLVVLIYHVSQHPNRLLSWAIGLLVVAALGGALLFANDLRQKAGPLGLVVIHAVVAVAAVALVAAAALG